MFKLPFILTLFLFVLGRSVYAQNYLQEAAYIQKISVKLKALGPVINFDVKDGIPQPASPADLAAFNLLVQKLITTTGGSDTQKTDSAASQQANNNTNAGEPPTGGHPQPNELPAQTNKANSNVNSAENSTELSLEIANELRYLLFISYNNDPAQLKKIIGTCPRRFNQLNAIHQKLAMLNSSGAATNFAFSESEIIYGIVDFTISRGKEQLIETYLSNWYDDLAKNDLVRQMLPNTLGTLKAFNRDESLNVAQYGDKWKAAFQEDFRNFPLVMQKESFVKELLKDANLSSERKMDYNAIITGGSRLGYDLYLKKHLVTAVNDLSNDYLINTHEARPVFKRVVVLSDVLLKAGGTLTKNDSYDAVSVDDISKMEYESWRVFLKLLYIRNNSALNFAYNNKIDALMPILLENEKIDKFAKLYRQTINLITTYQKSINSGANSITSELSFEGTRKIFELGFQLTEQVSTYFPYLTQNSANITPDSADIKNVADFIATAKPVFTAISQISEGISNRRYGSVLDGTLTIIRIVDSNEKLGDLTFYLQRYGSFMVNIINAKKADEVKSALEELVPKNLYKFKNTRSFTASVSSYPGIFGGAERISKFTLGSDGKARTDLPKEDSWAFAPAVYLPIGFDLSWGKKIKKNEKKEKDPELFNSTNVFFQVIDLGAVLNYRVSGSNSGEGADPSVTFKQVLSPGLAIIKHFNNSPLSIGASMSYTPSLRTINQGGNDYKSNALRVGMFLAVDVTYFNLFTSKKPAQ